jgi:hypothetical protein
VAIISKKIWQLQYWPLIGSLGGFERLQQAVVPSAFHDAGMFLALKTLKIDNFTRVNPIIIAEFLVRMIRNITPILLNSQNDGVIKSSRHFVSDVNFPV